MTPPVHRPNTVHTLLFVGIAALLWLGWGAQLAVLVPEHEHRARDANMKVSDAAVATFHLARWVGNYWYVLPLVALPLLAVVLVVSFVLQRRAGLGPRIVWFVLLLGLPLAGQLWTWLSVRDL
jgi:hypothetical protein